MVKVRIDGEPTDWKGAGLALDVLTPLPASSFDPAAFDATVKLGWDERGLLLFLEVLDATKSEASPTEAIWQGDSIEFFLADAVGDQRAVQYVIAPGIESNAQEPRTSVSVHGERGGADSIAMPKVASQRMPFGYTLEALVPWSNLKEPVRAGRAFGFQLYITDRREPEAALRKFVWFPLDGTHEDTSRMQRVALSNTASAAVSIAASPEVRGLMGAEILLVSSTEPERGLTIVNAAGAPLPVPQFARRERLWVGKLRVPLEARADRFGPIHVHRSGQVPLPVSLDGVAEKRAESLRSLEVRADSSVFQADDFPRVRPKDPVLARELLGAFNLETRWYDRSHRPVSRPGAAGRYGAVVYLVAENGQRLRRQLTAFRVGNASSPWQESRFEASLTLPKAFEVNPGRLAAERRTIGDWVRYSLQHGARDGQSGAVLLSFLHEPARTQLPKAVTSRAELADERWWHEQQKTEGVLERYHYYTKLPQRAQQSAKKSPGKRWPLVLFLHGSGERGGDLSIVRDWEPVRILRRQAEAHSFILIAPQCPRAERWSVPRLEELINEAKLKYPVDSERIYLMGASMGGYATWALATERVDWFAAAVPICGGGDSEAVTTLVDLPVWVFHGERDSAVPVAHSNEMVEALRARGGRVRYTRYPDRGHAAWTPAVESDELFKWLLEQRRAQPTQPPSAQRGAEPDYVE